MKKILSRIDKPLLISFIVLTIFGLLMIYSSSSISAVLRYNRPSYYFFEKQLIFVVLALFVGFVFVLKTPTKFYKGLAFLGLILSSIVLLSLITKRVLTNNASSWYKLGPVSIQPSEFVKSFSTFILTLNIKVFSKIVEFVLCYLL